MKTLISPAEVAAMAFDPVENMPKEAIGNAVILSAQHKFIKPLLGALYGQLVDGMRPELTEEYIKPPLALYVKWLLMPSLAVRSGAIGVVQHKSAGFAPADGKAIAAARRRVKADARALMRCALEHIGADPALAPLLESGSRTVGIL